MNFNNKVILWNLKMQKELAKFNDHTAAVKGKTKINLLILLKLSLGVHINIIY